MKYAADFRREAREALRGKWVLAILAGVVAMLLGGTLSPMGRRSISATAAGI